MPTVTLVGAQDRVRREHVLPFVGLMSPTDLFLRVLTPTWCEEASQGTVAASALTGRYCAVVIHPLVGESDGAGRRVVVDRPVDLHGLEVRDLTHVLAVVTLLVPPQ